MIVHFFAIFTMSFKPSLQPFLLKAHPDLLGNPPRQAGHQITSGMHRHHRVTATGISKVLMGAVVADMLKAKVLQDSNHLLGLEHIAVVMAHQLRAASPS